jgi:hypothetical protein
MLAVTSLALPREMVLALKMAACRESLRRGTHVSVSQLAREVFETHILGRECQQEFCLVTAGCKA